MKEKTRIEDIEEELLKLRSSDLEHFHNTLIDNLYDRWWCKANDIDYVNPDIRKAKEITYFEMIRLECINQELSTPSIRLNNQYKRIRN